MTMPGNEDYRPAKFRTVRFFPFLFFGLAFVGGHGWGPIVLSLLASIVLTAGVSFLLTRRQIRRFDEKRMLEDGRSK
jgi:hypothetical protein